MQQNLKFFYVRSPYLRGNITIASNIRVEDDKKYLEFAWTFCSNKDKFIKHDGREIAKNRLFATDQRYYAKIEVEEFSFYNLLIKILKHIAQKDTTPKKYLGILSDDIMYYSYCRNNGRPEWKTLFERIEKEVFV